MTPSLSISVSVILLTGVDETAAAFLCADTVATSRVSPEGTTQQSDTNNFRNILQTHRVPDPGHHQFILSWQVF
jgi:hypothetical protein